MAFRHFRLQVFARVVMVFLTMAALVYFLNKRTLVATPTVIAAVLVYQVWSLIRFVERTNEQLTRFLESVRHHDFSQSYSRLGLGRSFDGLAAAFDRVSVDFRLARMEKELQFRYLQTLVEHIGVGIITFRDDGEVELLNHAAKRTLRINHLRNIDRLQELDPALPQVIRGLGAGQRAMFKVTVDFDTLQLAIHATKIRRGTDSLTLISVQNIGSELAEQEMTAWQNLIRVLTHEIMNSVTPIASMAGSINDMVRDQMATTQLLPADDTTSEFIADLSGALTTIEKRSQGLLRFVEAYRNLTKIPRPNFKFVPAADVVGRVGELMKAQLTAGKISFAAEIGPPDLELAVDPDMIEQVLINLALNAIQALDGQIDGVISICARIDRSGRTLIEVSDNGPGIVETAIDKVFIPFFTTKKGGTGIGLALARQIMLLHGGNITVRSEPNERTCFTLVF